MAFYTEEILKKLQRLEMEILKDFDQICRENGMPWFAFGGTGIGAARHQGFIPWDDDIDVVVMRADYDRMPALFREKFPEKYQVISADVNENYPLTTTRIMLRDSLFVEESMKDIDCPFGIFLDVYPMDHVAQNPRKAKSQSRRTWFYAKLMVLSAVPRPVLLFHGWKARAVHVATRLGYRVMRLTGRTTAKMYRKHRALAVRYNGEPATTYAYFNDFTPFSGWYEEGDIFPIQRLPFEDMEMNLPNELDKTLRKEYGDYMQLPPEEDRKNHFPYLLKFPDEDVIYVRGEPRRELPPGTVRRV